MPKGIYIRSDKNKENLKKARAIYHKTHKGNRNGQRLSDETKQIHKLIRNGKKNKRSKRENKKYKKRVSGLTRKPCSEKTKEKIRESCKNVIIVHHINGNHFDDRPENRMLLTPREHAQLHIMQGDIRPYGHTICNNQLKSESGRKK